MFTTWHQTFVGGPAKSGPSSTDRWNQPPFSTHHASSTISGFITFSFMCHTTLMPVFRFTSCHKQQQQLPKLSQTQCVIPSIRSRRTCKPLRPASCMTLRRQLGCHTPHRLDKPPLQLTRSAPRRLAHRAVVLPSCGIRQISRHRLGKGR